MARQLAFKRRFVEQVQDGSKVQTLRKQTLLVEGDEVDAKCNWTKPPFARLRITEVRALRASELTEADARLDGFETVEQMRDFLRELYGEVDELVRISWVVLSAEDESSGT